MTLWIQRLRGEWRIARTIEEHDERTSTVDIPSEVTDLLALEDVSRFGVSNHAESVTITPLLADRSVVSSPDKPFYIPAGETVTVYVGSPLWVRIEAGDPAMVLAEFPIVRPSDTWFGPNTYQGELCYASRTVCRLRLEDVSLRPHRAITAVAIKNNARRALRLERMKLPVVYLPLFHAHGHAEGHVESGAFWTSDLTISYDEGEALVPIEYDSHTPKHAGKATLVAPARNRGEDNVAMRMFSSLFS